MMEADQLSHTLKSGESVAFFCNCGTFKPNYSRIYVAGQQKLVQD